MTSTKVLRGSTCAIALMASFALAPMANAQSSAPVFAPMSYDDDFSHLSDPALRNSTWAKLKFIPVAGEAYLTVGGEARVRTETRENLNFGRGVQDEGFDLQHRVRLWGDLNINPNLRDFGELQATGTNGDDVPTRNPIDHNVIEGHQYFVEASGAYGDNGTIFARAGRQEISIGKGRLFDPRNGPNTRRAYDALRVQATTGDWRYGALAGKTVADIAGDWNNETNDGFKFFSAHAARRINGFAGQGEVEFVYLRTDQETARIADFNGERETFSVRVAARKDALNYDLEAMIQGGETFSGKDVQAWFVGGEATYQLQGAWKPRLGTRFEAASGDKNAADNVTQTFDSMWGRGQTFTTEFGYANMLHAGVNLNVNPMPKLSANVGVTMLQRIEKTDGVYSMAPALLRGANEGTSRNVGIRTTARVDYNFNSHVSAGFLINHVDAGKFLEQSGTNDDLFYTSVFVTTRF